MSNFDAQAVLDQVNQLAYAKLQSFGYTGEELEQYAQYVTGMNQTAVELLLQEPGIQLEGSSDSVPLDQQSATQATSLFSEGFIYTLMRCMEYRIPGELIPQFTQNVAQYIYEKSKQIVAATHGQEHTPEFQFTMEQQVSFVTQDAESTLLHFINEYEKEHGPLHPEGLEETNYQDQAVDPASPEALWDEPSEAGAQPAPPKARPASAPQSPTQTAGPENHEKYAAVALLMTTLEASHRAKFLKSFNPEEKELIAFYSYPQHVEQNLDVAKVQAHLQKLKAIFARKTNGPKSNGHKQLATLAGLISREKLLSCVKDERLAVKHYLSAHYAGESVSETFEPISKKQAPPLSPRLEEILYNYLSKRLAPELSQSLPNEGSVF